MLFRRCCRQGFTTLVFRSKNGGGRGVSVRGGGLREIVEWTVFAMRHGVYDSRVAITAGERMGIGVDGGEGAEEQAGDVSEDGGAAGRDDVTGQKNIKRGERMVDALRVLETGGALDQLEGEVVGTVGLGHAVTRTERCAGFENQGAALASLGGHEMAAFAGSMELRVGRVLGHLLVLNRGWGYPHPGYFLSKESGKC
jgi:hypothetical protein